MTSNVEGLERVYHAARQQWDKVGETLPADWHAFLATQMPAPSL